MKISSRKEALILFFGDFLILLISLWLTLFVRYQETPSELLWTIHFKPFIFLYAIWCLVFFITGLYEKHTLILTKKLPQLIFNAQLANVAIALIFFYLTPVFSIAPKANLIIYLAISSLLLYIWRRNALFFSNSRIREHAIVIGHGKVLEEVVKEVNNNPRYFLQFTSAVDLAEFQGKDAHQEVINRVYQENVRIVVIDMHDRVAEMALPHLSNLMFSGVQFIDLSRVYEEIFDKIPFEIITLNWFLEHISLMSKRGYSSLKRLMDIVGGGVLLLLLIFLYPFIALAIFIETRGPIFFRQERLGERNRLIYIPKFKTMDVADSGEEALSTKGNITRVGRFLRKTRLDEIPQLWSVIKGDLSLIGPRPEIPELARVYEEKIPYYSMRHLIKPGLSGWAQLYHDAHPHGGTDIEETKEKLSYDLYYLKNRSFVLDFKIALKTLKKIITRSGV